MKPSLCSYPQEKADVIRAPLGIAFIFSVLAFSMTSALWHVSVLYEGRWAVIWR